MRIKINTITMFILACALGPAVSNAVPTEGPDGHFYEIITYPAAGAPTKSWEDARTAASGLTHNGIVGHLATITSAAEDSFINGLRLAAISNEAWVGGFQDLPCSPEPTCGWTWINGEGTFSGVNSGPGYSNWLGGEPNNAGTETQLAVGLFNQFGWNDEQNLSLVGGFVVEFDAFATETFVGTGDNQFIFAAADEPNSNNPLTAAYQEVLVGGTVSIDCCRVLDPREGAGKDEDEDKDKDKDKNKNKNKKFGDYRPKNFDLGLAVADTVTNPSCAGMPVIDPNTAKLRPWQRGVPKSRGINPTSAAVNTREHDIGVCLIQSTVESKGVVFSVEEAGNVLGYSVDCSETSVEFRPFTAGVSIDPAEVDAPYVTRWSAECDGSRSAKRYSDNVMVLNLRHYTTHKATRPYLSKLTSAVKNSIDAVKLAGCVDNSEGFLDNLRSLVNSAKKDMKKKGSPVGAVASLDAATKLALLIPGPEPLPVNLDPYGACPDNPKGLFVGRLMSLKFAVCSELVQANGDAKAPANCAIDPDILLALPPLPGV